MGLHWQLTAGFLYTLMSIIALLLIPFISSTFWNKVFKSNMVKGITGYSAVFFRFCVLLLILVIIDATRDCYAWDQAHKEIKKHPETAHPGVENTILMKLFRAQRNLHIGIFALFSWFVFRMLVNLISQNAQIKASQEASLQQAKNATKVAQDLITDQAKNNEPELEGSIKKLQDMLNEEVKRREKAEKDVEAMCSQGKQLTKEYERITNENRILEEKLRLSKGLDPSDKKKD